MARPRKAPCQVWECPICQYRYEAPLKINAAMCPTYHLNKMGKRGGHASMVLIEGEMPAPRPRKLTQH